MARGKKVVRRPERLTFSLREVKRPISQEVVGHRLIFVVPNSAKFNMRTGEYETSYHYRYCVHEVGDFNEGFKLTKSFFLQFIREHNIDAERLIAETPEAQLLVGWALKAQAARKRTTTQPTHTEELIR